jgi:hypothetical protein
MASIAVEEGGLEADERFLPGLWIGTTMDYTMEHLWCHQGSWYMVSMSIYLEVDLGVDVMST